MDYKSFSIIYSASYIMRKGINIVRLLHALPENNPGKFRALRLGVARAAARMRYAMADCGSPDCDAFESFKAVVVARALELGEGKKREGSRLV